MSLAGREEEGLRREGIGGNPQSRRKRIEWQRGEGGGGTAKGKGSPGIKGGEKKEEKLDTSEGRLLAEKGDER